MSAADPDETKSTPEANHAEPAHGFEGATERDGKSHQGIGKHSREVERKIGEQMPDRK